MYGASRLGMARVAPGDYSINKYEYELSDHLGNVRATFSDDEDNKGKAKLVNYTDYYPFGWEVPNRIQADNSYRFAYQGQFAEKDVETGFTQFEARLFDNRIRRWMSPDPAEECFSPYLGMGNNPISRIDPDGQDDYILIDHSGNGYATRLKLDQKTNHKFHRIYKQGVHGELELIYQADIELPSDPNLSNFDNNSRKWSTRTDFVTMVSTGLNKKALDLMLTRAEDLGFQYDMLVVISSVNDYYENITIGTQTQPSRLNFKDLETFGDLFKTFYDLSKSDKNISVKDEFITVGPIITGEEQEMLFPNPVENTGKPHFYDD